MKNVIDPCLWTGDSRNGCVYARRPDTFVATYIKNGVLTQSQLRSLAFRLRWTEEDLDSVEQASCGMFEWYGVKKTKTRFYVFDHRTYEVSDPPSRAIRMKRPAALRISRSR